MEEEQLAKLMPEKREVLRRNAERLMLEGTDCQKEAAARVLASLENFLATERTNRAEEIEGLTQAERVAAAFRAVPATATEARVIQVLSENPNSNTAELSSALGWSEGGGWHMHFGKMCNARADYLWPAPFAEKRNADFYCGILCDTSWETGKLTYALKPEVADAFRDLGMISL